MTTRSLLVLLLAHALGACATTRGEVPAPPNDAELANDGSPEPQGALERKFSLRSTGNAQRATGLAGVDMGNGRRPSTGGVLDMDVEPDVAAHLGPHPAEVQAATRPWRWSG